MADDRRTHRSESSPGPRSGSFYGGALGGGLGAATVARRYYAQMYAHLADPMSRLGALASVSHPQPGTIASGVRSSISAIHLFAGSFGEAAIGGVFNHPAVQQRMTASPGTFANPSPENSFVARSEYSYWQGQMRGAYSRIAGDLFAPVPGVSARMGGLAGSAVLPAVRAGLQTAAMRSPYLFPVLAAGTFVTGTAMGGAAVGRAFE